MFIVLQAGKYPSKIPWKHRFILQYGCYLSVTLSKIILISFFLAWPPDPIVLQHTSRYLKNKKQKNKNGNLNLKTIKKLYIYIINYSKLVVLQVKFFLFICLFFTYLPQEKGKKKKLFSKVFFFLFWTIWSSCRSVCKSLFWRKWSSALYLRSWWGRSGFFCFVKFCFIVPTMVHFLLRSSCPRSEMVKKLS